MTNSTIKTQEQVEAVSDSDELHLVECFYCETSSYTAGSEINYSWNYIGEMIACDCCYDDHLEQNSEAQDRN